MSNLETSGYTSIVAPRPLEVDQSHIFNQLDRKGTSREEKKSGGGGKTFQDQELTEGGSQDEAVVRTFAPSVQLNYKTLCGLVKLLPLQTFRRDVCRLRRLVPL